MNLHNSLGAVATKATINGDEPPTAAGENVNKESHILITQVTLSLAVTAGVTDQNYHQKQST
jgi:hypothetical protein